MKKKELINAVIVVIIAGLILTAGVNLYISGAWSMGAQVQETMAIEKPGDVISTLAPEKQAGPGVDTGSEIVGDGVVIISTSRGTYEDLRRKLDALDASLSTIREGNSDTSAMAKKNREDSELSAWTAQMNVIYDTISEKLDDASRAALARSQAEKMEEIASDSEAVRARAYELLELYKDVLE